MLLYKTPSLAVLPALSHAVACFSFQHFCSFPLCLHTISFPPSLPSVLISLSVFPLPPLLASFSRFHVFVLRFLFHMPLFSVSLSFSVFLSVVCLLSRSSTCSLALCCCASCLWGCGCGCCMCCCVSVGHILSYCSSFVGGWRHSH